MAWNVVSTVGPVTQVDSDTVGVTVLYRHTDLREQQKTYRLNRNDTPLEALKNIVRSELAVLDATDAFIPSLPSGSVIDLSVPADTDASLLDVFRLKWAGLLAGQRGQAAGMIPGNDATVNSLKSDCAAAWTAATPAQKAKLLTVMRG